MTLYFHNVRGCLWVLAAFLVIFTTLKNVNGKSTSKLSKYTQSCKKDDPQLNNCLKNAFETLFSKAKQGIPEIGLPQLDPLVLKRMAAVDEQQMKLIGHDIKILGISTTKINYFKADLNKLEFDVSVRIPFLKIDGTYDVDAVMMNIPLKTKGPLHANATDGEVEVLFQGKIVEKSGSKYLTLVSGELKDYKIKSYHVDVGNLVPDPQMNAAMNEMINNPATTQANPEIQNVLKTAVLKMLLKTMNSILAQVPFDDLFEK